MKLTQFHCSLVVVAFALFAVAQKQNDVTPPTIEEMMASAAAARSAYAARPDTQQVNSISGQKLKDALIGKMSDKGWRLLSEDEHLLRFERPILNYDGAPIISAEILMYPKDSGVNVNFIFFGDRKTIHDDDVLAAKIDILQSLDDISKPVVPAAK
jgi:hypothetical protein